MAILSLTCVAMATRLRWRPGRVLGSDMGQGPFVSSQAAAVAQWLANLATDQKVIWQQGLIEIGKSQLPGGPLLKLHAP